MNKREFLQTGALAGVGALVFSTESCSPKSVGAEVTAITSFSRSLIPLLPTQAQLLAKIITLAGDFNAAYQAGKFANATTLFGNLSDLINQLTGDIGVNLSPQIKMWIGIVNAAVQSIAVLLKSQATPAVMAAVSAAAGSEQQRIGKKIEKLADPKAVDAVFRALTKQ